MQRILRAAAAATALLLFAGSTHAQRAHEHRGFWIGFGLGGGINLTEGMDGESLAGGSGYIRLGGTPSQRVLLGFESIGWARGSSGTTLGRANSSFVVLFYPTMDGGLFFKGGVGGASVARVSDEGNTTTTTTESGFGVTLGAGWDVRIGRNLYLSPNLDLLLQMLGEEEDPVLGNIPSTNSILLFTLGLTWH
jgi:hypothetical protein